MQLTVTTREGDVRVIAAREGLSVMQNIRNAGLEEVQAICGGSLSCATCHVYVDELPPGAELPAQSPDEVDLLDASDHLQANSRLSCQLACRAELDGLCVTVAPEDD